MWYCYRVGAPDIFSILKTAKSLTMKKLFFKELLPTKRRKSRANQMPSTRLFAIFNYNIEPKANLIASQNTYRHHRSAGLQDIGIQKFDGNPLKWNERISIFKSAFHNRQDITNNEQMSYLQTLVIGLAKDCNPFFYDSALEELDRRFESQKLESWLIHQPKDLTVLISYPAFLRKLVQAFFAHRFNADLKTSYLLIITRDKINFSLEKKWSDHLVDKNLAYPWLEYLSWWMDRHHDHMNTQRHPESTKLHPLGTQRQFC